MVVALLSLDVRYVMGMGVFGRISDLARTNWRNASKVNPNPRMYLWGVGF